MLVVSLALFLIAAIGHAAVLVYGINYLYGTRYRGWWITGLRHIMQLLVLVGPPAILWVGGTGIWTEGDWLALPPALLAYLSICWTIGGLVVPYQTVTRWRRKPPSLQLSNHTTLLDVAARIGRKPCGRGRQWYLGYLPGNQIFQVDLTEKTFHFPQLPAAWDGLTILHLSDLHLSGAPDRVFYERVLEECREPAPDVVAITGDIMDSRRHYDWITPVLGRLRWRIAAFAILGNHDAELNVPRIARRVERLGIEMLGHCWKQIMVRGAPLIVIGNEMPWLPPAPDLTACPREGFRLCLSHSPDTIPWARRHQIDLLLAGHNHGGQVRLPGFGSILCPSIYSRRYDCGTFYEAPTLMHVSRGLGGTHPVRYHCRPEVTRIVLRSAPQLDHDAACPH